MSDWIDSGNGSQIEIRRNEDESIDEVVLYMPDPKTSERVCVFHMEQNSKRAWYFTIGGTNMGHKLFNIWRDKKKVVVRYDEDD
jgi:hypothetical protein